MSHYCRSRYDLVAILKTLGAGRAQLRKLIVGQWLMLLALAAVPAARWGRARADSAADAKTGATGGLTAGQRLAVAVGDRRDGGDFAAGGVTTLSPAAGNAAAAGSASGCRCQRLAAEILYSAGVRWW
jgi:hypothetical protein